MLTTFKHLVSNQLQAALCTLHTCIVRCPDRAWEAPVASYKFCQAAFHTLFFADFYLGHDTASFKEQPFHNSRAEFFRDYEEFQPRAPSLLYDKATTLDYVRHCRTKADQVISDETEASLPAASAIRPQLSRAELYVYNTRHIQHHAAQLSLRLRLDHGIDIPWVAFGWRDL